MEQTKIGEKTMQVEKRTVPDDNDCLFSALSYLTSEDSSYSPAGNATLRKYCAEVNSYVICLRETRHSCPILLNYDVACTFLHM